MILNQELSTIYHMFKNCAKLIEFSINYFITNIDEEEIQEFEGYFDYNENNTNNNNTCYSILRKDDIYPHYSEIT